MAVSGERLKSAAPGFHRWLTAANDDGCVNRQELVSMIPPLLLKVRAGHRVLDTCAAVWIPPNACVALPIPIQSLCDGLLDG
eukprot:SAG31_NODE_4557_length_3142_cov_1.739073_3_plen_82_part_00